MFASQQMTVCIAQARMDGLALDIVLMEIERNIHLLIGYLGGCERIRKTPLPFAYVVHLRRALAIYCLTLPFALLDSFGWFSGRRFC